MLRGRQPHRGGRRPNLPKHDADRQQPVSIGEVLSPFGVRGELKVLPLTDSVERLLALQEVRIRMPDQTERTARVERARIHKNALLLKIEGCNSIDEAEAYRGAFLVVALEERAILPPDTFYVDDILGLRVVTDDGREIGTIREVLHGPANDVYDTGQYLIPALKQVVVSVDLANRVMVVHPMPGMLDDADEV